MIYTKTENGWDKDSIFSIQMSNTYLQRPLQTPINLFTMQISILLFIWQMSEKVIHNSENFTERLVNLYWVDSYSINIY